MLSFAISYTVKSFMSNMERFTNFSTRDKIMLKIEIRFCMKGLTLATNKFEITLKITLHNPIGLKSIAKSGLFSF